MSGKISHQKKYSAGAKSDWIGVPGVRNSVTGKTWKLNIITSTVAQSERVTFLVNDSKFDSRNWLGIMRKQRIVANTVKTRKITILAAAIDTAPPRLPSTTS